MKLIREYINEKFTEDSDPISDLGIGVYAKKHFNTEDEMFDWLSEILPTILDIDEFPEDILNDDDKKGYFLHHKYSDKIGRFANKYLKNNESKYFNYDEFRHFLRKKYPNLKTDKFDNRYERKFIKESLNEKFTEDSDPIEDLGIGMKKIWEKELKRIGSYCNTQFDSEYVDEKYHKKDFGRIVYDTLENIIRLNMSKQKAFNKALNDNNLNEKDDHYIEYKKEIASILKKYFSVEVNYSKIKSVNEKFTDEDSDPIEDLGIGMAKQLKKLKEDIKNGKTSIHWENDIGSNDNMLWICAKLEKLDLIKYLLNIGANIHYLSDRALRWAVANKNYEIVEYLIENGADVNSYNHSPLRIATDYNDKKMISLLKKYGAEYAEDEHWPLEEKFTEDSDPIYDLRIGLGKLIDDWVKEIEKNNCHVRNYKINKDGTIDAVSVDLSLEKYHKLPEYIKFNRIENSFSCNIVYFEDFKKSCPKYIGGNLEIYTYYNGKRKINFSKKDIEQICEVNGKIIFMNS